MIRWIVFLALVMLPGLARADYVPNSTLGAGAVCAGGSGGALSSGTCGGGSTTVIPPQGRLTLISGEPVMQADAVGVSTVYYDSYVGNQVPIYNGTSWSLLTVGSDEISMGLSTTNHVSGSVYDLFGVSNSGTLVICTGPAWTSTTARSTALARQNGIWTNSASMTHCFGGAAGATDYGAVAANEGTYLGSFYATANGQTTQQFKPPAGTGGSNNFLALFNAYNQIRLSTLVTDSNLSWTYSTSTWRPFDGSSGNTNFRVTYLDGLGQSTIETTASSSATNPSGEPVVGAIRDSINTFPIITGQGPGSANSINITASENFPPAFGMHFIQQMEFTIGGTSTFFSQNAWISGQNSYLSGLLVEMSD